MIEQTTSTLNSQSPNGFYSCINTLNKSQNNAWITIYEVDKIHIKDYGWSPIDKEGNWRAGNYLYGSFYWVRAEVKDNGGEHGTIADLWVQVNPGCGQDPWVRLSGSQGSGFFLNCDQSCGNPAADSNDLDVSQRAWQKHLKEMISTDQAAGISSNIR